MFACVHLVLFTVVLKPQKNKRGSLTLPQVLACVSNTGDVVAYERVEKFSIICRSVQYSMDCLDCRSEGD